MKFANANAIKKWLRQQGYLHKVQVRKTHNPFGGEDKLTVKLAEELPRDCSILSKSESGKATQWFSDSDVGREYIGKMNQLSRLLTGTNSFVVLRFF